MSAQHVSSIQKGLEDKHYLGAGQPIIDADPKLLSSMQDNYGGVDILCHTLLLH